MASPLNRRLKSFLLFLFFLAYGLQLTTYNCYAQANKEVRVAVLQGIPALRLKIKGFYEVADSANNKVIYHGKNLNTTVTTDKDGILLGNIKSQANSLFISPQDAEAIIIDGRLFRGKIKLIKDNQGKLLVVNHIGLEDYVKGILYHEASHYWPMEALKAQAIVCRTYAIYQMQENVSRNFDVTSDIYSQVYGGRTSERYRTNKAVDETRGSILTYQNKPFPTYYHATCGGATEDASILWKINIPPLKGVPCAFCKNSVHFSWHYVLSTQELKQKLAQAGHKIDNIKDIKILGKDKSGRITGLKIIFSRKALEISAKDFRNIIGPNIIRSTNFSVSVAGNDIVFVGLGWGHGVGMCQWGAYFMAKQGRKYDEILKYYYPETKASLLSP